MLSLKMINMKHGSFICKKSLFFSDKKKIDILQLRLPFKIMRDISQNFM